MTQGEESAWDTKGAIIETRIGVMIKFLSNGEYGKKFLSTGNRKLMCMDIDEGYWSCGEDMKGKNLLGVITIDVRDKIRSMITLVSIPTTLTNIETVHGIEKTATADKQLPSPDASDSDSSSNSDDDSE